jgi:hypothetical protein
VHQIDSGDPLCRSSPIVALCCTRKGDPISSPALHSTAMLAVLVARVTCGGDEQQGAMRLLLQALTDVHNESARRVMPLTTV